MKKTSLLLLFLFLVGCSATNEAVQNYESCKNDPECYHQMLDVKEKSYIATKTGLNLSGLPSAAEVLALVVSNMAAFGVGVLKGKKKANI